MPAWKDKLTHLVSELDNLSDKFRYRLKNRMGINDPVMIMAFDSFGTSKELNVFGRVIENEGLKDTNKDTSVWDNIRNMYLRFESDEIPGAKLKLIFHGKEYETFTNEEGYFKIPILKPNVREDFYIEFSYNDDRLFSNQINNYYYGSTEQELQSQATHFFTDRAIYRPGQSIYFKGIVTETKGKTHAIKPGIKTAVTFYDVNRQKISVVNLTTNEFGTFSGSFTAPAGKLTGTMSISNSSGSTYFQVEEYKRPKFEVLFEPVKESYRLGEMVTVKGNAKTYSGAVIDNSAVTYRVVRRAIFPFRDYFSWWKPYPTVPDLEITNGEARTNEKGEFVL